MDFDKKGLVPRLPSWFKKTQRANYFRVLREELRRVGEDLPEAACDFEAVFPFLSRRTQRRVLRRIIVECLPRKKVILHRGSFKQPTLVSILLKRIELLKYAPFWFVKEPRLSVLETEANLKMGIGGIEIDVVMNSKGEPVIAHPAIIRRSLKKAPHLAEFLQMIRGLLSQDLSAPRQARRGLEVLLDIKMNSLGNYKKFRFPEKVLRLVYEYPFLGNVVLQGRRPGILYDFDRAEKGFDSKYPGRRITRYMLQVFPICEMGEPFRRAGILMKKAKLINLYKEGRLVSRTRWWRGEYTIITEFPPHGKIIEILKRHKGLISVSPSTYNKSILAKVQELGLGLHLGGLRESERVDEYLGPDSKGRRPESIIGLDKEAVFPKEKISPVP